MKSSTIKGLKIVRNILLVLVGLVVLFFAVRFVGQRVNAAVPQGGSKQEFSSLINYSVTLGLKIALP